MKKHFTHWLENSVRQASKPKGLKFSRQTANNMLCSATQITFSSNTGSIGPTHNLMDNYVIWRPVTEAHLIALQVLDSACLRVDGPASVPTASYHELLAAPNAALLCAATPAADYVAAVGWVQVNGRQARLGGTVHPEQRHRRLGTYLVRWAESQALTLGSPSEWIIRNETFNAGSAALYAQEGYTADFVEYWMQRDLREPLPPQHLIQAIPWTASNARQFFEVYVDAFKERPGFPGLSADQWLSDYTGDADFRPDLSLLALMDGYPVGFVTSGVTHLAHSAQPIGWISQIGIRPNWRGHGIAAGLITRVMVAFKAEGLSAIGLHVNRNNPGAIRLFQQLEFRQRGQRAKYVKHIPIRRMPADQHGQ
jgi:mycothiol synthase